MNSLIFNSQSVQTPKQTHNPTHQLLRTQQDCPICLQPFDIARKAPMMICFNQHSSCEGCLKTIYHWDKCPLCFDPLIPRHEVRRNRLICEFLLELMKDDGETFAGEIKAKSERRYRKKKGRKYEKRFRNGNMYEGFYQQQKLQGDCKVVAKQGAVFTGVADGNVLDGSFKTLSGSKIQGKFEIDSLLGINCKKTFLNGNIFDGRVQKFKASGYGLLTFKDGNTVEGSFVQDCLIPKKSFTIQGTFQTQIKRGTMHLPQINTIRAIPYANDSRNESD